MPLGLLGGGEGVFFPDLEGWFWFCGRDFICWAWEDGGML